MKPVLVLLAVTLSAVPAIGAIAFSRTFDIPSVGPLPKDLTGTISLDNGNLKTSLAQDGTTLTSTHVALSDLIDVKKDSSPKIHLYADIVVPAAEAAIEDIKAGKEDAIVQDATQAALDAVRSHHSGSYVNMSPLLQKAQAAADILGPALKDFLKDWPNVKLDPTEVADIIQQLQAAGALPAKSASDLNSILDQGSTTPAVADVRPSLLSLAAPVPEPVSLTLLALGGLAIFRRTTRR